MYTQVFIAAFFAVSASGAPFHPEGRQLTGTGSSSGLGSLPSGLPTGTGIPALPTGLLGGLGGSGSSGLGGDLLSGLTDSGTSTDSTQSSSSDVQIASASACKSVTVLFARGTTETGTLGSVVGPSLSTAVQSALNNDVTVQGVAYAADIAGITSESTGAGTGSKIMIADVKSVLSSCPNTKIVLTGYSQGAMLVHNTMASLSTAEAASVKACVTFGDPFVGTAIKNFSSANWKSFCGSGDTVCSSGVATSPASGGTTSASTSGHLGYGSDTTTAATFIKGKVAV